VIVSRLTLAAYDGYLQGLSGEVPVVIGGSAAQIDTRYSTAAAGQTCWQYAYETLTGLGYSVRYQDYTRNGNALRNVIATIPGETTPDSVYVVGAHLDSKSENPQALAPGAEDNASGSAAVLAAAAALVGERFASTIELVLFTGEEQGLWGSTAYVADAVATGSGVQSAVTFDMISAWVDDYGVLIEGETAWQPLMFLFADAVDTYTTITRTFSYFSFGSDHVPFQDAGIPAILAIEQDWAAYADYHRTTDTYDKTTPALGLDIARAGLAVLLHQAGPLGPAQDAPTPGAPRSLSAYPNPASQNVTATFLLGRGSRASDVRVVDLRGRIVRSLSLVRTVSVSPEETYGEVRWDLQDDRGRPVRPGVYWLHHGEDSRKVVVTPCPRPSRCGR
jgi:hypothetical protein